jgi:chorismate mutase
LLLGYPEETLEAAVDNVARRVIRYMETVEKKDPKESQHHVLEKEKKKNRALLRKLRCVGEKIIKKNKQVKEIMDASDAYIEKICMSTDQIDKIGSDSLSSSCNHHSDKYDAVLVQLRAVATNISQSSVEIIDRFKAVGVYP